MDPSNDYTMGMLACTTLPTGLQDGAISADRSLTIYVPHTKHGLLPWLHLLVHKQIHLPQPFLPGAPADTSEQQSTRVPAQEDSVTMRC